MSKRFFQDRAEGVANYLEELPSESEKVNGAATSVSDALAAAKHGA